MKGETSAQRDGPVAVPYEEGTTRIDIHTHFLPHRFYEVAQGGQEWYGASLVRDPQGQQHVALRGKLAYFQPFDPNLVFGANPENRIRLRKEQEGIDVQAVSIAGYLWNYELDPQQGAAFCREVNRELAELQKTYPQNIVGLALLPLQDTRAAMQELEYAVKDLGLRGVAMCTNVLGRNLDDPSLFPLFEAASSESLFLFCHPPTCYIVGQDRMERYALQNLIGGPVDTTLAIASLIFGGVLDRCPNLTICFCQGGGYAPYGVGRLTHGYNTRPPARSMQRPPEDYLGSLYYDCLIHSPASLRFLVEQVSEDRILLGTDFPFPGAPAGGTVQWLQDMPFLSEKQRAKILGGNAALLLGLAPSATA